MTTDFKRNLSGRAGIYEYSPLPPINAVVMVLTTIIILCGSMFSCEKQGYQDGFNEGKLKGWNEGKQTGWTQGKLIGNEVHGFYL